MKRQHSNARVYPGSGRGAVRLAKGCARALYCPAPAVLVVGVQARREREGSSQVFARGGVDWGECQYRGSEERMCYVSSAERCVLPTGPTPFKGKPASSLYRHKEGRCTCIGDRGSHHLLPESRGCSDRALWEVHCGVWRRAWLSSWVSSLVLRRSRQRPCSSSGRLGRCCMGYRPPGVAWRRSEGLAGQGLVLVKAGAASEGRAHAVRGLRGRESMKEYGELAV